mmetsp:Transcript_10409/g.13194  ORF Transcript_10409/g.13194 Transcript_10409/m.13194 type:complete len:198 (-) Transcript_10409:66-659(-)
MARLLIIASILLASFAPAASSVEPHLRQSQAEQLLTEEGDNNEQEPCSGSGIGCGKTGSFSIQKGMKCDGGFDTSKGVGKHCEGGMKSDFDASSSAHSIVSDVAGDLAGKIMDFVPDKDKLIPMVGNMEELLDMDTLLKDVEDGFSRTMEFGGYINAAWGCKVTYEKEDGEFSKTVECGFRGDSGMGPKPSNIEAEF